MARPLRIDIHYATVSRIVKIGATKVGMQDLTPTSLWADDARTPSGAAQALVRIAKRHPDVLREALA